MGIDDKIKDKSDVVRGEAKEAAGRAVDDEELESEGKLDQAKARLDEAKDDVTDAAKDAKDNVKDAAKDAKDAFTGE
jgi:uncharacterized protein YjbJ (UPF0337 family)